MSDERPTLYHFTCDHGYAALGASGVLTAPVRHPFLGCRVIWLTTQATPDRESTGLGQNYTTCDRMKYRYVVTEPENCRPWLNSVERWKAPAESVADLEAYGDPEHWWITDRAKAVLSAPTEKENQND